MIGSARLTARAEARRSVMIARTVGATAPARGWAYGFGTSTVKTRQRGSTSAKARMLDPDATAMCCLPSNTYVIGDAFHVEFV